jgi:hypothetical protein
MPLWPSRPAAEVSGGCHQPKPGFGHAHAVDLSSYIAPKAQRRGAVFGFNGGRNLFKAATFIKQKQATHFHAPMRPCARARAVRPNGPFRPPLRQSTYRRAFLMPRGHPDIHSTPSPFPGNFPLKPTPDPHRQLPGNGQKARPQLEILKILWLGWGWPFITKKRNRQNHVHRFRLQKLYLPRGKLPTESHAGTRSFSEFLLGFCMGRWRYKASKTRPGVKLFYFVRKSPWSIPEPPGAFSTEQAQRTIGGSKPASWRCGLFIFLEI